MITRQLGATGLEVPAMVYGAYAIGGVFWGAHDESAALRSIEASLDAGMNAFDTAPIYGLGHSEELLGRALRHRSDEVVMMTKVGMRWDDDRGPVVLDQTSRSGERMRVRANLRPDSVRAEVRASLGRLGFDRIDLVQVHRPDPRTPIADTMGALAELRAEGLVREIGVSNYTLAQVAEARTALGDVPLASIQPHFSLLQRDIEADLLPYAREHGIGILAYSPLDQGLLTGRVTADRRFTGDDRRARRTSFLPENRARVNAVLQDVVLPIADAHDATLAQVVLAWTVAAPGVTCALVGTRTPEQATENAGAGALLLSDGELATIGGAFGELELVRPKPSLAARARMKLGWRLRQLLGR